MADSEAGTTPPFFPVPKDKSFAVKAKLLQNEPYDYETDEFYIQHNGVPKKKKHDYTYCFYNEDYEKTFEISLTDILNALPLRNPIRVSGRRESDDKAMEDYAVEIDIWRRQLHGEPLTTPDKAAASIYDAGTGLHWPGL